MSARRRVARAEPPEGPAPTTPAIPASARTPGAVALALGAIAAATYASPSIPLSNIDDFNMHRFAAAYWGSIAEMIRLDWPPGRFRPMYWVLEGALGAITGSSGTILHAGRLLFLAGGTALSFLLGRRLGAPAPVAAALALVPAWSVPATETWTRGGPAEAFAQPLTLAAILLVLRARGARAVAIAAAVGLVACLVKESYGPWVGAALLARAIVAFRESERGTAWASVAGVLVQLLPAVIAAALVPRYSGSYLERVFVALRASPREAVVYALYASPLAFALAGAGTAAIAARLARARAWPWRWPLEDLVAVGGAAAMLLESVALGFIVEYYHLPLVGALALLAARGAAALSDLRRPRRAAAVAALLVAPVIAAGAARTVTYARTSLTRHRMDERLREQVATALQRAGGVRIFWVPGDVERPIGVVTHLRAEGVEGQIQLVPCGPLPAGQEQIFRTLFEPYVAPIERPVPAVVSLGCGRVRPTYAEPACLLVLPLSRHGPAGYHCFRIPELAALVAAP